MNPQSMINVLFAHVHQQLDLERRTHGATEQQCQEVIEGLAAKLIEIPSAAALPEGVKPVRD